MQLAKTRLAGIRRRLVRRLNLEFDDESLEKEWRRENYARSRRPVQIALGFAFFVFLSYGAVDKIILPELLPETDLWLPRFLASATMVAILMVSLFSVFERHWQSWLVAGVMTAIVVLTWLWMLLDVSLVTPMHASVYWYFHNGLVLIIFYSFLLLRLRFRNALLISGLTLALFIVIATLIKPAPQINTVTGFSIFIVLAIGLFTVYIQESAERRSYRQRRLIELQRRELQDSLERLQKTQRHLVQAETMASLGQLASGVAHEIRNPLNFVSNFAALSDEIIEEVGSEGDPSQIAEFLDTLRENTQKIKWHAMRADDIVRHLIEHADQNRPGVQEPTDLNQLVSSSVKAAAARLASLIDLPEIRLECCEGTLDIIGVRTEIGTVVVNLVDNALRSAADRTVSEPGHDGLVVIRTSRDAGAAVIEVSDNGTGVAEDIRGRIFEPFFTTREPGKGAGLGLFLTYQIIRGHGGEIRLDESRFDETCFNVRLPLSD